MKFIRIAIGTIVALALSISAFAAVLDFPACTSDNKAAVLTVDINDEAIKEVPEVVFTISKAFKDAAASMSAEDLITRKGFEAFVEGLDEDAAYAIQGLTAPTIGGDCK